MTSYLPDTRATDVGNILYAPTSGSMATDSTRARKGLSSVDTVESVGVVDVKKGAPLTGRPVLPLSKPTLAQNEMMQIAAAFCEAYTAMKNSIITETNEYAGLQQLDQTQVQAVLASTSSAIEKLKVAEKSAAEIQAFQEKLNTFEKYFGKSMFWIGLFMIVATIGSALVTGGASLAALPEEAGMIELAEMGTEVGVDVGADLAADTASTTADAAADAGAGASEAASSGASSFNWGAFAVRMGIAGAFASPQLVSGICNAILTPKLRNLAAAQQVVGEALDIETRNNMYMQFLQQLVQRESGIVTEAASEASEVIDTYSSVMSSVRGMSYGLANAV